MENSQGANETTWRDTLESYVVQLIKFAAENPKEFVFYFFIFLTPIMLCSAVLSYMLIKEIEAKDRDKKKKGTKQANLAKTRRKAMKAD